MNSAEQFQRYVFKALPANRAKFCAYPCPENTLTTIDTPSADLTLKLSPLVAGGRARNGAATRLGTV